MPNSELHNRIQQQCQVVEGGNPAIRAYNESEIERLLDTIVGFDKFTDEQLITIHYVLAEVAGETLLSGPPTLRVLPPQTPGADSSIAS